MVLIDGAEFLSQTPEWINLSLICEPINVGLCSWSSRIFDSIAGVVWRGFEPPITPGRYEPVSWKRFKIFETQPCDMRNSREILHGLTPFAAISIICNRIGVGNGRPLMKTPPSWFSLPWPNDKNSNKNYEIKIDFMLVLFFCFFEAIMINLIKTGRSIRKQKLKAKSMRAVFLFIFSILETNQFNSEEEWKCIYEREKSK